MVENPVYSAVPPAPACPRCGKIPCACPGAAAPKQRDPVLLRLDKSGRKGKSVTLLSGLQMHPAGKEELLRQLQKICGAGGTVKNGTLEIQGDHRERLKTRLEILGYRVKTA